MTTYQTRTVKWLDENFDLVCLRIVYPFRLAFDFVLKLVIWTIYISAAATIYSALFFEEQFATELDHITGKGVVSFIHVVIPLALMVVLFGWAIRAWRIGPPWPTQERLAVGAAIYPRDPAIRR